MDVEIAPNKEPDTDLQADVDVSIEQIDPPTLNAVGPPPKYVRGLADTLPYAVSGWENFERLLHRIAHRVLGWSDVHTYGKRGQKQYGIDVVGRQPDGSRGTIQTKRYETFDESDLRKALDAFDADGLPVKGIKRLIVVTAAEGVRAQIVDLLSTRQDELAAAGSDLKLEFWNAGKLDDLLRDRGDIVTEFFGAMACEEFCGYRPPVTPPVAPQQSAIAEMVMRGPTSNPDIAQALTRAAEQADAKAFDAAASAYDEAQLLLVDSGFVAHARMFDEARAQALIASGQHTEAARLASNAFWDAVDDGNLDDANAASHRLSTIPSASSDAAPEAGDAPETAEPGADPLTDSSSATVTYRELAEIGSAVIRHPVATVGDPLATVDLADVLRRAQGAGCLESAARLLAFVGETAISHPTDDWVISNAEVLREAVAALGDSPTPAELFVRGRLQMVLAELDGWASLLSEVGRRAMTRPERTTVQARAALAAVNRGHFEDADRMWQDAIEGACLDGHNDDAAEWVYARRNVRQVLAGGGFHAYPEIFEDQRLAAALQHLGGGIRQSAIRRAAAKVADATIEDKHLGAVLNGRAYLRLAYVSGSWRQVLNASNSLARAYVRSSEPLLALQLHVSAAAGKDAADLVDAHQQVFLDVTNFVHHASPVVVSAALVALSHQADLIPDDRVADIVDTTMQFVEEAVAAGAVRPDHHSRYLSALKTLASLAHRTERADAERLVELFLPVLDREPGHRYTTDDQVLRILNGVGRGHSDLAAPIVRGVVAFMLLDDDTCMDVRRHAVPLLQAAEETALPLLREASAGGSSNADAMIARLSPDVGLDENSDSVKAALQAVLAEPDLDARIGYLGTDVVSQSLLLRDLEASQRRTGVAALLRRVEEEPDIKATQWPAFLVAAFNLASNLGSAPDLFERSLAIAEGSKPSDVDGLFGDSVLSTMRLGLERDPRSAAAALTARLATSAEEIRAAEQMCLSMLPWTGQSGELLSDAFGELPNIQDVALLASQQVTHLRVVAARAWVRSNAASTATGLRLANDSDVAVRVALAAAIARASEGGPRSRAAQTVLDTLRLDVSYRVRSQLSDVV
ncbi:hypothetical protein [Occultella gossypii]|uniref:Restriction endonuclease type IV Mrr domain-containing protein n=1 Tax=Occultella gossypii TaxID=2800820 RepID=A0ABS7SF42_9MICO|nr:hypothetical protein [Occultella gossypii]MBZ2198508.1 hypothetical protein [Occultella gossypii]